MNTIGEFAALASLTLLEGIKSLLVFGRGNSSNEPKLQILHDDRNAEVDIICVHGLRGDSKNTWVYHREDGSEVNWITDLLPHRVGPSRIMAFDYKTDSSTIRDLYDTVTFLSTDLLNQLVASRQHKQAKKRPLIFISHSFGGLVVKNVLIQSGAAVGEERYDYKAIQLSTVKVLFFGVPQHNSTTRTWQDIVKRLTYTSLDKPALKETHDFRHRKEERLSLLAAQLDSYKSVVPGIQHYCFCEKMQTIVRDQESNVKQAMIVVPWSSIRPPPEMKGDLKWLHCLQLNRSHENLVKFGDIRDLDFVEVIRCMSEQLPTWKTQAEEKCGLYLENFRQPTSRYLRLTRRVHFYLDADPYATDLNRASQRVAAGENNLEPLKRRVSLEMETDAGGGEALHKLQETLVRYEMHGELVQPRTLHLLRQLANIAVQNDDHCTAQMIYTRIFIVLQEHNPLGIETAEILCDMASAARKQGHYIESSQCLCQAKKIQENRHRGHDDHPDVIAICAQLAIVYDQQGRFLDAERLYERVLRARERMFGPDDERTISVLENLALHHCLIGKPKNWNQAVKLYYQVLQRRDEVLSRMARSAAEDAVADMEAKIAATTLRLADLYLDSGQAKEAQRVLRRASTMQESATQTQRQIDGESIDLNGM